MNIPHRLAISVLGAALSVAATGAMAAAAEPVLGNAAAGQRLARVACARCHHVERTGPIAVFPAAKPFRDIAADPKMTALSLRVFLRTPHIEMPDYILTEDQTDDLIAYILSLK